MTQMEIDVLEQAGRLVMGWSPEGRDGHIHLSALLAAALPAVGILSVAAAFLFIAF